MEKKQKRINGEINTLISKEELPTVHHISDTIFQNGIKRRFLQEKIIKTKN